ncbi:MAG TPA: TRAP transporter small permease, partial [Candidatus Atribacteria bacterium]|nr:TRAP transporter small permease [Candidatus Atribacteria bacterium]
MKRATRTIVTISDVVNRYIEYVVFAMMVAMTTVIILQIIFRFFFTALSWSEEVARFLLVWSSLLAASIGFKKGSHITVSFLVKKFPENIQKILSIIAYILEAVFFFIIILFGIKLMIVQATQTSAALLISMSYIYSIYPIGGGIILLHL